MLFHPYEKLTDGSRIGFTGVPIADLSGKEFEEAREGLRPGLLDNSRYREGFQSFRQWASL